MISRHFIDVHNADGSQRRVHYRKAGSGPLLLMVHQSPRSSAEYAELMLRWAADFTCIAPDTAGFGDSAPLPHENPECEDYADALIAFLDALGLDRVAAYGFHSGAIILVTAARRHASRFSGIACGGYAVWTAAEKADFGAGYTPPFRPLPYGEHLAWLWGRVLEQSWFFPWYRAEPGSRLAMAHADPQRVQPIIMECLSAGDNFSKGYAAVLRANRDIPAAGEPTPPVLIAAYDGDPLKAHLARLGTLPVNWSMRPLATPAELEDASRSFLLQHPAPFAELAADAADEGFATVSTSGFTGQIHWKGSGDLFLHAPGSALTSAPDGMLAIDLPGHGLSGIWSGDTDLAHWVDVVTAALEALDARPASVLGQGWSSTLASAVAARIGAAWVQTATPSGSLADWRAHGLPDLTPDSDGTHLLRAWRAVRAGVLFDPWFAPSAATALPFQPCDLAPETLATRHLALMRASAGRQLLDACLR